MMAKEKLLTNRLVVFMIMLFLCIIWGSAYPIVKIGYDMLQIDKSHVPSIMMFAGIRYVATGLLLLIPGIIMSPKSFALNRAKQGCVLINTAFQVVGQYYFYYIGLARTPGTRAAIINSSTVFIAIFLAAFLFKTEKYNIVKFVASLMAVASVVVLNHVEGFGFSFSLKAEGFILVSSFLTAVATCLQKPLVGKTGVMPLCSYSFLLGGVLFLIYAFSFGGKIVIAGPNAYALLVYVSLVSALGFSIQALLLKYNDVSVISIYRIMLPVSGVILSAVMLKEHDILFRLNTLVSLFLMIGAMLLLGAGRRKKSDSELSAE